MVESRSTYECITRIYELCVVLPLLVCLSYICHMYEWDPSDIFSSHATRAYEIFLTHKRVEFRIWKSHMYAWILCGPSKLAYLSYMCHTYKWVMSDMLTSHVTLTYEICLTCIRVGSRKCIGHTYVWIVFGHIYESCLTHIWDMYHIWTSRVPHMNEAHVCMHHLWSLHFRRICHICVTHLSGSCRTCWRVMSHSRMSVTWPMTWHDPWRDMTHDVTWLECHAYTSRVPHMNWSHVCMNRFWTYLRVMSHLQMRYVSRMNESGPAYKRVTHMYEWFLVPLRLVNLSYMCHTYECVCVFVCVCVVCGCVRVWVDGCVFVHVE